MPNAPLQTFRAVEAANYGFGASVSLASRPFVLYHQRVTIAGATLAVSSTAMPFTTPLPTNRFFPWVNRVANGFYPVTVPNAYDRIAIHNLFTTDTNDTLITNSSIVPGAFSGGIVIPMGLAPETRGCSLTVGNGPRLPEDLVRDIVPTNLQSVDTRTNGHWLTLPPYAVNFSTNHGVLAVGAAGNAVHYGRNVVGTGNAYALPDDFTISNSVATDLGTAQGSAGTTGQIISGGSIEYATMGCSEIVVSIGANPVLNYTIEAGTLNKTFGFNWFVMGMFLG
jgi:hypothetical protein